MLRTWLRNLAGCSRRLRARTEGQDLIEYALLIGLISTTLVVTLTGLGVKASAMYSTTADLLPGGYENPENPPPGHGGTPPGQGGAPPGQGTPPGQGGTPPGQGN